MLPSGPTLSNQRLRPLEAFDASEIANHLLAGLHDDAVLLWTKLGAVRGPGEGQQFHAWLHAQLAVVRRHLRAQRDEISVHMAALVMPNQTGALLVGESGSGKSTLALRMAIQYGAGLVSDDTSWFAENGVVGFGAPLALRSGSDLWDSAQQLWYAEQGERVMVLPEDLGGPPLAESCNPGILIFPSYGDRQSTRIEWTDAATAFCQLVQSTTGRATEQTALELANLCSSVPAATVSYRDGDEAARICVELADAPNPTNPILPRPLSVEDLNLAGLSASIAGILFGEDVVLWSPRSARAVHLRGWTGSQLDPSGHAYENLKQIGFLDDRAGHGIS